MTAKLSEEQVAVYVGKLADWSYEHDALVKTFPCRNFQEAVRVAGEIAVLAEEADHHPELCIRQNLLTVSLTTHDSGGVTGKDFSLAGQIDSRMPEV